jgi:hypothetical protein
MKIGIQSRTKSVLIRAVRRFSDGRSVQSWCRPLANAKGRRTVGFPAPKAHTTRNRLFRSKSVRSPKTWAGRVRQNRNAPFPTLARRKTIWRKDCYT